ncbi:Fc receptor-like protein 4, partial [Balearica regulorum gibbericeps]|uniref:Fc receptor-like protein 4 n=1 Tax=Balearica regulorum gibbericeps TaxID=100784 RepID=UPI003F6427F0
SPSDLPLPPNITVTPEKTEYLIGDTVSLRCVAPWSKERIQGFQFSGTSGWAVDVRTTKRTYTYRFNVTGPKDGGAHACTYTIVNRLRQPVRSQDSKSIILSVRDHPPQPALTFNSSTSIAIEGQTLVFLCKAPAGDAERRFRFYKEKVKVINVNELTLRENEAQLQVAEINRNFSGNFTCGYEEKTEGRWIPSYPSQAVQVLVKEPASAPTLGVDPPTRVVSENYPLRLTCEASRDDFGLRFRFYRNGVEIQPGQGGSKTKNVGNFSEILFPQSPRKFGGTFSCGVEENVGGIWMPSPRSEGVNVAVRDLPSRPALLSDPPSGEVMDGDPLILTCIGSGSVSQRKFYFYKDGDEQFSETTTRDRSLFNVSVATTALTTGDFTCRYEEKVNDGWIPSPFSQSMMVVTQARSQLTPLVAGCAAGAAALFLGFLLVVCLCRRRRGSAHWKGLHDKDDPSAYPMANFNPCDV